MGFLADIIDRLFPPPEEHKEDRPITRTFQGQTYRLNPLYRPRGKREKIEDCTKELDRYMKKHGGRPIRTPFPRPKMRKRTRLAEGDIQTVARVKHIEEMRAGVGVEKRMGKGKPTASETPFEKILKKLHMAKADRKKKGMNSIVNLK